MPFEIVRVEAASVIGDEQLGSKNKFWFLRGEERWLFKESRPETGEDWAEKIASEVAHLAGVRAATVELAEFNDKRGSAGRSFVERREESLVHGNEILAGHVAGYDRAKRLHQSDHTLENISAAVKKLIDSEEIYNDILRVLAEYFVLDALICNTDRHHENWGFLIWIEELRKEHYMMHLKVAPSFDHASSLGRELRDEGRQAILDRGGIAAYVRKGRGGLYLNSGDKKGASPLALVESALKQWPDAFAAALKLVASVSVDGLHAVVDNVPESRMSNVAKTFSKALLSETHHSLKALLP